MHAGQAPTVNIDVSAHNCTGHFPGVKGICQACPSHIFYCLSRTASPTAGVMPGTLTGLPVLNRRKVGMTSSHHGLYAQGLTRATMAATKRRDTARWSQSQKGRLSSDCRLATRLHEAGIASNRGSAMPRGKANPPKQVPVRIEG